MPFYVYILYSSFKDKFYIGFTSNLEERLIRHNKKTKVLQALQMIGKLYTQNYIVQNWRLWQEKNKLNPGKAEAKSKY